MGLEVTKNIEKINDHLKALQKEYKVKTIGIFGSVARDTQTKKSDVDVLIEFSQPLGFFKFIELENFLSGVLKKKVDLVSKNALKESIKDQVLKEVVYAGKKK